MANIIGIDHVQLALPPGGETLARQFYNGLLGLPELEKPASLAVRGGCWFDCGGGQQIHVGGETEFRPARKAHPALLVNDLAIFLAELRQRGLPADFDEPVPGAVRATIADPFGNRIELIERQAR
jgi:catechol 2,3-dioxygenase-like lactoylglutathione lyase family enzyme